MINMDDKEIKPVSKKMKWLLIIFLVAAGGLQLWKFRWPKMVLELKGEKLNVLVADTYYHQRKGLGGRESLSPYDGMLFLFSFPAKQAFVMRDMEFPIDIVWLKQQIVVDMAKNVQIEELGTLEEGLQRYYPRVEATAVLELPAGWADSHQLQIGDALKVVDDD